MSYCVNCGVELDSSNLACPLCNTPVLNPTEILFQTNSENKMETEIHKQTRAPFPHERGTVEVVKRRDVAILLSVVLVSTGLTCGLLNLLVFTSSLWSVPIMGACALIWVFAIPAVIYTRLSIYSSILFDGVALGAYLFLITYLTASNDWFFALGMPIVVLLLVLTEIFLVLIKHIKVSFLTTALYVFAELAILCVGIEIFIDLFLFQKISLTWSAAVLAVCTIIVIALITVLSIERFRNEIRRRLHF